MEIIYVVFKSDELSKLDVMYQGKNSNDRSRPPKYSLHLERVGEFLHDRQQFTEI